MTGPWETVVATAWILVAVATAYQAENRSLPFALWLVLGLALGPVALAAVMLAPEGVWRWFRKRE